LVRRHAGEQQADQPDVDAHGGDAARKSHAFRLSARRPPRNPLGVRAMYRGSSTYRIHGTDAPWTVGQEVSQGGIRMYNDDVIDLFNRLAIGTKVVVLW
jgi:lipoprotein-anchoring transpeptidase ErfK/SrfK